MEEAKNRLIEDLYTTIHVELIFAILLVLCIIVLTIIAFANFSKYDAFQRRLLLIVIFGITVLFGIFVFNIHLCYKDYRYLESNGDPIYIEGELIDYAIKYTSEGSSEIYKSSPIIRVNGTNEEITLRIDYPEKRMKIGETYEIVYLPYTKFAEIIEK
jgi:ABC-type polysaccharide/polyol phosphate export permease